MGSKITVRAYRTGESMVLALPAYGARHVEHILQFPIGACPVSRNPLSGDITVSYDPDTHVAEVASLFDAVAWACSNVAGTPSSVEEFASWLRAEVRSAVVVDVSVVVSVVVNPGGQRLVVRA